MAIVNGNLTTLPVPVGVGDTDWTVIATPAAFAYIADLYNLDRGDWLRVEPVAN